MATRVVSLIPSATEILARLVGPKIELVGVTHECDHPDWVTKLPKVVSPSDPRLISLPAAEVDSIVSQSIGSGKSLYKIDIPLLDELMPDVVVTQSLCDVCAVSPSDLQLAIGSLRKPPTVIELNPMTIEQVLADILKLGELLGEKEKGKQLHAEWSDRLEKARTRTAPFSLPGVAALEWIDPPWIAGHWVPEMIDVAGGVDLLGRAGELSRRATIEEIAAVKPDVLLLICCGYDVSRNREQAAHLKQWACAKQIPAISASEVYALDANSYFSRPAPRIVEGVEILSQIFHHESIPPDICQRILFS